MTYLETLMIITENKENVLAQDLRSLITETHRYLRTQDGWCEDKEPGAPDIKYTPSGPVYVLKRKEEPLPEEKK